MSKSDGPKAVKQDKVTFHYIKDDAFRTVYMNGAIVGATPHGEIVLTPFIERNPIPTQVVHAFNDVEIENAQQKGKVGDIVSQVCRNGLIREMELNLIVLPDVAEQIGQLLIAKATEARKLSEERASNPKGEANE